MDQNGADLGSQLLGYVTESVLLALNTNATLSDGRVLAEVLDCGDAVLPELQAACSQVGASAD